MGNWVCEKFSLKTLKNSNNSEWTLVPPTWPQNPISCKTDDLEQHLLWHPGQNPVLRSFARNAKFAFFGFSPLLCVSKCPIMGEGSTAASPNWTDPQITVILHSRPLLHFLTLILILHSRSQFAFYEDLRNKSLHPTAFYFLSNQFGKSSVPRCFFLGFGVSGGSSEGNPGNVDRGGSLHVSVIGISLVWG